MRLFIKNLREYEYGKNDAKTMLRLKLRTVVGSEDQSDVLRKTSRLLFFSFYDNIVFEDTTEEDGMS